MKKVKFKVTPGIGGFEGDAHKPTIYHDPDFTYWIWHCSCGSTGRKHYQSPHACMFLWFKHAYKALGFNYPKDHAPAYTWLRQEEQARK